MLLGCTANQPCLLKERAEVSHNVPAPLAWLTKIEHPYAPLQHLHPMPMHVLVPGLPVSAEVHSTDPRKVFWGKLQPGS